MTRDKVAHQGALLFASYATGQVLSFARNALIGHTLAKSDFGIAASIALMLQLFETLSDFGSDRLIVQAADGATERFLAASHTVLVARGVLLGLLMLCLGPLLANFFGVPQAAMAFQLAGFAPLIKGFMHLDCRREQRMLNNAPQLLVEVAPQALALAATVPLLAVTRDYSAVVWLALFQAGGTLATSHLIAKSPYRLAIDEALLKRQLAFGWPILASAVPLIAVYQGDRMMIGRLQGMDALAAYTAAFMVTMVPGLIAAKVGHALMLPLFSEALRQAKSLRQPFNAMSEATSVLAALFLSSFIIAGETALPVVFGPQYAGLGSVTAWLAAMWSLRMVQAVPGMALMAQGETKPFLVAGVIRAHALPCILWAIYHGCGIATIAAIGCGFELLSLGYIAQRLSRVERGLCLGFLQRATFLIPTAAAALLIRHSSVGPTSGPLSLVALTLLLAVAGMIIAGAGVATMPCIRAAARRWLRQHAMLSVS